jgi:hypothetical protein
MLDENSEAHAEHNALILKGLHRAEGRFLDLLGIAPYYYFSQYFQGVLRVSRFSAPLRGNRPVIADDMFLDIN